MRRLIAEKTSGVDGENGCARLQRRGRGLLDPVDAASRAPRPEDSRRRGGHLTRGLGDRRGGRLRPSDLRNGARFDLRTADRGRAARDVRLERRSGAGQALAERRHHMATRRRCRSEARRGARSRRISWLRTTSSATWMHRVPTDACGTSRSSSSPDGYLFVSGVDLDVRTKVALDLGWEPVPELMAEIHDGDPLVRADWPWHWWGLEPLDRRRTRLADPLRVSVPPEGSPRREHRLIQPLRGLYTCVVAGAAPWRRRRRRIPGPYSLASPSMSSRRVRKSNPT